MLNLQKTEVISSSENHTSDSDIEVPLKTLNLVGIDKDNDKSKLKFFRFTEVLRSFPSKNNLDRLDKRLLKGFYTNEMKELCVDSDDADFLKVDDNDDEKDGEMLDVLCSSVYGGFK